MDTEEKGNTAEVSFDVWETDWSDEIGDEMTKLIDKFDGYTSGGTFKVTIVFTPDTEEDEEND